MSDLLKRTVNHPQHGRGHILQVDHDLVKVDWNNPIEDRSGNPRTVSWVRLTTLELGEVNPNACLSPGNDLTLPDLDTNEMTQEEHEIFMSY